MMTTFTQDMHRLGYVRPAHGGWVTGACAALARGAHLSVAVVRLLVVLAVLATGGWFVVAYLAAAVVLPREMPHAAAAGGAVPDSAPTA